MVVKRALTLWHPNTEILLEVFDVKGSRGLFLFTIALGVLLNPLNSSMISVAMVRLQHVFHLQFSTVSWLISTYYLGSAIAQPVMGKLADFFGRKRVYILGLFLVLVTSITAPFSPNFLWLLLLRMIQSIGSSAIYPAGMAMVRHHITDDQARALAFLAVFSSGAAAFGPTLGGLLLHAADWPALFFVNLPILVAAFVLAWWVLPVDKKRNTTGERVSIRQLMKSLDAVGILLFAVSIVGLLWFLLALKSGVEWAACVVGVLALVVFVVRELRASTPFINLRMFAENRTLMWVHLQFAAVNILFYSVFFGIPAYLQEARQMNAQDTGFMMLFLAGISIFVAPIAGRWIDRAGSRPALLLSASFMVIGAIMISMIYEASPMWWMACLLLAFGISNGFNNVGMQTALFASAPKAVIGSISGLFMTARFVGTIVSSVFLGVIFGTSVGTRELRVLGIILLVIAVCVVWMSLRLPKGAAGASDGTN